MTRIPFRSPYRDSRAHRARVFEELRFEEFVSDFRASRERRVKRLQRSLIAIALAPFALLVTVAVLLHLSLL
jgi:hypothetical protein